MPKIYINDVGTEIRLVTNDDLTGATLMRIDIRQPDGTVLEKTATLINGTTLTYTTVAGDIDATGTYDVQGYVEFSSHKFHTERVQFVVYALWS